MGAAAQLGFCYVATGTDCPARSPGRQQQWPMVVSELVWGRHLSWGTEPGTGPIQLPRCGHHQPTDSLLHYDFTTSRVLSSKTNPKTSSAEVGRIICRQKPRYTRLRAHPHLIEPFPTELQVQPYFCGYSGVPGVLSQSTSHWLGKKARKRLDFSTFQGGQGCRLGSLSGAVLREDEELRKA